MAIKISKRLSDINQMITQKYHAIWDCCCDHGYLGLTLLQEKKAQTVHFVDNNQNLIKQLEKQLKRPSTDSDAQQAWRTHCINAAKLPLNILPAASAENKHLIILAGIGGDLVIDILNTLLSAHANVEMEFILFPLHDQFKVRTTLINAGLKLINEKLVQDNNRFYEIIHVGNSSQLEIPVSNIGSTMWDLSRSIDRKYLNLKLAHYQRRLKNGDTTASQIIAAYTSLK